MIVVARDQGEEPRHSSTAIVNIFVRDVSDSAPEILLSPANFFGNSIDKLTSQNPPSIHYLELKENEPPGIVIGTVMVTDRDEDGKQKVNCSLNSVENFRLEPIYSPQDRHLFSLLTSKTFDREKTQIITTEIICRDRGFPPTSSILTFSLFVAVNIFD